MAKLSIIIPIYFNEENIPYTLPRLLKIENLLKTYQLEFIFVDDGSKDNSFDLLYKERKNNKKIKIIKLSKNFGSFSAIQAGLNYASGDCIGIIAADLQDPPELFSDMIKKWENGTKIVLAVREKRKDPILQRLFSHIYYWLIRKYAIKDYPKDGFDFVLLDKQVVYELNKIQEKNINLMNLIFWLGYKKELVPYIRQKRTHGKSKWTFMMKFKLLIDSFIAFSYAPIRAISMIGIVVACVSFIYGIYVIINALLGNIPIQGWSTIISK